MEPEGGDGLINDIFGDQLFIFVGRGHSTGSKDTKPSSQGE